MGLTNDQWWTVAPDSTGLQQDYGARDYKQTNKQSYKHKGHKVLCRVEV